LIHGFAARQILNKKMNQFYLFTKIIINIA